MVPGLTGRNCFRSVRDLLWHECPEQRLAGRAARAGRRLRDGAGARAAPARRCGLALQRRGTQRKQAGGQQGVWPPRQYHVTRLVRPHPRG